MQKIERWIKQNVWISEMDGSEHLTEHLCGKYEKRKVVTNLVEGLMKFGIQAFIPSEQLTKTI